MNTPSNGVLSASASDAARVAREIRAERRDRIRTWFTGGALVLSGIAAFAAFAAWRGTRTLEARDVRDDALALAAAAKSKTTELESVNASLEREINERNRTVVELSASIEKLRIGVLEAEAASAAANAMRNNSPKEAVQKHSEARFFRAVQDSCLSPAATPEARNDCARKILRADSALAALSSDVKESLQDRVRPGIPAISFSPSAWVVEPGTRTILTWSSSDATSCVADGGWAGTRALSGTFETAPVAQSTTYSLQCSGPGGTFTRSITVDSNVLLASNTTRVGGGLSFPWIALLFVGLIVRLFANSRRESRALQPRAASRAREHSQRPGAPARRFGESAAQPRNPAV